MPPLFMHTRRIPALAVRLGWLAPVLTLSALSLTVAAQAQVTQYGSRSSFNAAASSLTTFTFNGYAPQGSFTQYSTGLTVQGVTFTASPSELYVDDPGDGAGNPFNGSQYLDTDANQSLNVVLPTGTTAFGADFSSYNNSGTDTITALVNGMTFTFKAPSVTTSRSVFAGFTSLVPITSLSFSSSGEGSVLDNVSFGTASPSVGPAAVPEPAPLVSLGIGILGLGGLVLRARRKAKPLA